MLVVERGGDDRGHKKKVQLIQAESKAHTNMVGAGREVCLMVERGGEEVFEYCLPRVSLTSK